jgi:hypothetical protein
MADRKDREGDRQPVEDQEAEEERGQEASVEWKCALDPKF